MRCLVCNENGVIVLCFRYKSTVREIAFQRGWSLVVCRTFRDSWLFVEGSRLDAEPSMIWGINVEGSVLENGTVRDIETQRGRFQP